MKKPPPPPRNTRSIPANKLKPPIDRVLNIKFIEPHQVDRYIKRLDGVLAEIVAHGAQAPSEALEAVLYFIETIPSIYDSIQDETELAMFCEDLCGAALSLQTKANRPLSDVAPRLLDAFLQDDYGRMEEVPNLLASHCPASEREWLREEATRRSAGADSYKINLLAIIIGTETQADLKHPKLRR